jgi:hypothetical protein
MNRSVSKPFGALPSTSLFTREQREGKVVIVNGEPVMTEAYRREQLWIECQKDLLDFVRRYGGLSERLDEEVPGLWPRIKKFHKRFQ